eukprot:550073-Pleurochrysis_carterae.AAC.1
MAPACLPACSRRLPKIMTNRVCFSAGVAACGLADVVSARMGVSGVRESERATEREGKSQRKRARVCEKASRRPAVTSARALSLSRAGKPLRRF